MALPPVSLVRQHDTHRLISSRHSRSGDSVLVRLANDDDHLRAIFELEAATNDRLAAGQQRFPGIGVEELVFGVPWSHVVNAAFCHPHPLGSRFNGPDRGAWYAAFAVETAQEEIAWHKSVELAEIGWTREESATYDDYLADFSARFHDLRGARDFHACLDPESYAASQTLAEALLDAGSLGVIYPSVRHGGGTCLACFRPPLVMNVRRGLTYRFTWMPGEPAAVTADR
jgi:hypothetical protein